MHGRLKVKTTAEQAEAKRLEREKRLKVYKIANAKVFEKRAAGEFDKEGLDVSGELLSANPDFYTLWNWRRETFLNWTENRPADEMNTVYSGELGFTEQCLRVNPKSYSVWHHRGWVMDTMPQPDWQRELKLCNRFLEYDERNFHCWDYRRFVVKNADVSTQEEFEFSTDKISTNFSNYSSWHYRSKLLPTLHPDCSQPTGVQEEALLQEFELAQNAFFTDPNDQSAWFYNRWLLNCSQRNLSVECLHVTRQPPQIVLQLSKASKLDTDFSLAVQLDGATQNCSWRPVGGAYCHVWTAPLEETVPESAGVSVTLSHSTSEDQSFCCQLTEGSTCATWRQTYAPGTKFSYGLSAATSDILSHEIESCQQLHELEPDNKWVLLTTVLLMRVVDPMKHESETQQYLDKLLVVDPLRAMYYTDLRSRFAMETRLESLPINTHCIDLSHMGLTCYSHMQHLITMTTIDLSHNALRCARGLCVCVRVRVLRLDHNQLESCAELGDLTQLEELSLAHNNLSAVDSLAALTSCPQLHTLHLVGNPLTTQPDWEDCVKQLLPRVQHLL